MRVPEPITVQNGPKSSRINFRLLVIRQNRQSDLPECPRGNDVRLASYMIAGIADRSFASLR
jgi:hypothetical protein